MQKSVRVVVTILFGFFALPALIFGFYLVACSVRIQPPPLSVIETAAERKHFLTVGWKDEQGKQHAAVFELGKSIIRTTIATLEARTGKKVDYQDDEARKSGLGGI